MPLQRQIEDGAYRLVEVILRSLEIERPIWAQLSSLYYVVKVDSIAVVQSYEREISHKILYFL